MAAINLKVIGELRALQNTGSPTPPADATFRKVNSELESEDVRG